MVYSGLTIMKKHPFKYKMLKFIRVVILIALLTLVSLTFSETATAQDDDPSTSADRADVYLPKDSGRHFYLTSVNFPADEAPSVCTTGFHMATLWEILDVSNLIYDYDHPDAYTKGDSGFGPPSNWYGWVRTGYNSSSVNTAGMANCSAWTSTTSGDYGTIVRLASNWVTAPGEIGTWDASTWGCGGTAPVWCVGEFSIDTVYLPVFNR